MWPFPYDLGILPHAKSLRPKIVQQTDNFIWGAREIKHKSANCYKPFFLPLLFLLFPPSFQVQKHLRVLAFSNLLFQNETSYPLAVTPHSPFSPVPGNH